MRFTSSIAVPAQPNSAFRAVVFALAVVVGTPAYCEDPAPRVEFSPAIGVPQDFRVVYQRAFGATDYAGSSTLSVEYRLTVTPLALDEAGYRLDLLVSDIVRPDAQDGMNMPVAAVLMLDELPIEVLVDGRGFFRGVVDWDTLRHTLGRRASGLSADPMVQSIARSVIDDPYAKQVAAKLALPLSAMNRARSYVNLAEKTGTSVISWHGFPFEVTVDPPDEEGRVAISWSHPAESGTPDIEGRAVFLPDGFAAPLAAHTTDPSGREIIMVERVEPN